MSYVQGTRVRLVADFTDEHGQPTNPIDAVLTVVPPGTVPAFVKTLAADELQLDEDRVGRVFYVLDTTPIAGTWEYQFESVGNETVVGRKQLTVKARLNVPS